MGESTKDTSISLKVMRLTRPSFQEDASHNMLEPELEHLGLTDSTTTTECETSGFSLPNSQLLLLPQNFENIYLGETFTCYVCLQNNSKGTVKELAVKIDLQTSSQRLSLPNEWTEGTRSLGCGKHLGQVVSHEVKEQGQHILVCAVTYTNESGEKQYFRKYFKFSVEKPLDVKTKFYNAENDDVYLEAQIQNITKVPMSMERVSLDPSSFYTVTPLNSSEINNETDSKVCLEKLNYLPPFSSRQYLYCLRPRDEVRQSLRGVTPVGRLEMIWRSNMGERGRLQTSQLQRMVPGYGDLRLTVVESPSAVKVKKLFTVTCKLYNASERSLSLFMCIDESVMRGMLWCAKHNRVLGSLEPGQSLNLTLPLVPLLPGLQSISGLRLTDTFLNRTYEHDDILQVYVYS